MKRFTTAVLALALLGTTPVLAADYGSYHRDRDSDRSSYHRDGDRDRDYKRHKYHSNYRHAKWRHGMRLPHSWRYYTMVNWRAHHLRYPPYGYHWIYVDGVYLLISPNGLIIEVVA